MGRYLEFVVRSSDQFRLLAATAVVLFVELLRTCENQMRSWPVWGMLRKHTHMIRILLLDCPQSLTEKLKLQGFDVEAGTIGFATGKRNLPSQVYEKDVFFYSPTNLVIRGGRAIEGKEIEDCSPEYSLEHLHDTLSGGATFVVFVNRVVDDIKSQDLLYSWIPFMPPVQFTKDKRSGKKRM